MENENEDAHDQQIREEMLDQIIKLTEHLETQETERWNRDGRPKNDGYINGSHSGYSHAMRDIKQYVYWIKEAHRRLLIQNFADKHAEKNPEKAELDFDVLPNPDFLEIV